MYTLQSCGEGNYYACEHLANDGSSLRQLSKFPSLLRMHVYIDTLCVVYTYIHEYVHACIHRYIVRCIYIRT